MKLSESPSKDSNGLPSALYLYWKSSAGAEYYRLQVAKKTYFVNPFVDRNNIADTHFDVSALDFKIVPENEDKINITIFDAFGMITEQRLAVNVHEGNNTLV